MAEVAAGERIVVRDEEWLVRTVRNTERDGVRVEVTGVSSAGPRPGRGILRLARHHRPARPARRQARRRRLRRLPQFTALAGVHPARQPRAGERNADHGRPPRPARPHGLPTAPGGAGPAKPPAAHPDRRRRRARQDAGDRHPALRVDPPRPRRAHPRRHSASGAGAVPARTVDAVRDPAHPPRLERHPEGPPDSAELAQPVQLLQAGHRLDRHLEEPRPVQASPQEPASGTPSSSTSATTSSTAARKTTNSPNFSPRRPTR